MWRQDTHFFMQANLCFLQPCQIQYAKDITKYEEVINFMYMGPLVSLYPDSMLS